MKDPGAWKDGYGYWYLHINGTRIFKPAIVVLSPREYFTGGFVQRWWVGPPDDSRTPEERGEIESVGQKAIVSRETGVPLASGAVLTREIAAGAITDDVNDERRRRFERWFREHAKVASTFHLQRHGEGYEMPRADLAWTIWRAAVGLL